MLRRLTFTIFVLAFLALVLSNCSDDRGTNDDTPITSVSATVDSTGRTLEVTDNSSPL